MISHTLSKLVISNYFIGNFSRNATKLLHGFCEVRNKLLKFGSSMAESIKNASNSDTSNNSRRIRSRVNVHVSRVRERQIQERCQQEESIANTSWFVQNQNFHLNSYTLPNNMMIQCPYSVSYPNHMYPRLSYMNFHRQEPTSPQPPLSDPDLQVHRFRSWETVDQIKRNDGYVFTIMSYNVLAQDLVVQHPYLYSRNDPQILNWNIRWNNLFAEIKNINPDILCLQEVQGSHIRDYYNNFKSLGYDGIYKQRTGARSDGCAIYFKTSLVNLKEFTSVEYNQPNISILDRDNVAIIARFALVQNVKQEFLVATTHLLFNPKREDVRLAQAQLLLTEVDRLAFLSNSKKKCSEYLPVIITGDFNSNPQSPVYRFIKGGKLQYENLSSRSLVQSDAVKLTGKTLVPASLGITDQCQHAILLESRQSKKMVSRSEELNLIQLTHSERNNVRQQQQFKQISIDRNLFSSGTLSHQFSLYSVYTHEKNGDAEGTTFQDRWVTVDYIFYSSKGRDKFTLLERYKLPTVTELTNVVIPNEQLGSDHFCLAAKFHLNSR